VVCAPQGTTLEAVVRGTGTRWTLECGLEAATSEVGLEHDEGRSWTGWYRLITLARWALAMLTVLRAGAIAVEAVKKTTVVKLTREAPKAVPMQQDRPLNYDELANTSAASQAAAGDAGCDETHQD
jgi:SRSO17 transposase